MRTIADVIRWALILGIWGFVAYLLWGIAWWWAAVWVVPGFVLVMNLVGFATLPVYGLLGLNSLEAKALRHFSKDLKGKP